jgi:hypothetical protein
MTTPTQFVDFADDYQPGLEGGTYELTVTETVDVESQQQATYQQAYTFHVLGPRFSLDSADVHSTFPPPNGVGAYGNYLPQIVFTRSTLPWERTIDLTTVPGTSVEPPFLALLLLDDPQPVPVARTLAELLDPGDPTILHPAITIGDLDPGETLGDPCLTVDLPVAAFLGVVPGYLPTASGACDLTSLAHVRQVDLSTKATPTPSDDGWFSVVVGNRFPTSGAQSRAYLVSLEGYAEALPPSGSIASTYTSVRLCVLATWIFHDDGETEQFKELLNNLAATASGVTVPPTPATTPAAAADLAVGYVPLNHVTRQAEHLVSFYRGPLAPYAPAPETDVGPWPCSDALLRFDPVTGLLDTSYAAAWQLGRLLALADSRFAQSLYEWRRSHQRTALLTAQWIAIAHRFPSLGLPHDLGGLLSTHAVRHRISSFLADEVAPVLEPGPDGRLHRLLGRLADPLRRRRPR